MPMEGKTPGAVARKFKEGPFYVHCRTPEHGAVTFAVGTPVDGLPVAGWAFCAPRDEFRRQRGRVIAAGRRDVLAEQFRGCEGPYALVEQLVEALADARQDYDQRENGDGTVDPEPRIPRWFPDFAAVWFAQRAERDAEAAVYAEQHPAAGR